MIRRLARLITRAESGAESLADLLAEVGLPAREFYTVGVTGPPGSGKSTLVDKLIGHARRAGLNVGVVGVDPSSPFSGGALLGDRVRMLAHSGDRGVFIRSMAARRLLGGLAPTTRDVVRLIAAFGFDIMFVETVGVGQSELEIATSADTILVLTGPGFGDAVQALKAGLLEIADIFVVNMADRPGAERTVLELRAMQSLAPTESSWAVPIIQTVATEGRGLVEVWEAFLGHRQHLQDTGELHKRRRARVEHEVLDLAERQLRAEIEARLRGRQLGAAVRRVLAGEITPGQAAEVLVRELVKRRRTGETERRRD